MAHLDRLSGNEAVAVAMRQIDPDVMGAFPITPSTEIPQYFAQYVADGKVHTELVTVESEHSSMSVCIGAAAAGGRAISATSSCGLALMYAFVRGSVQPASHRAGGFHPCAVRPHQHQQRPFRRHGRTGCGLDSNLCGEQPGGI